MSKIGSATQVFERNSWVTDDAAIQRWVNEMLWRTLTGPKPDAKVPPAVDMLKEAFQVCSSVLFHNGLQGMALAIFGPSLKDILGDDFTKRVEADRQRSEIFTQEVQWLLGPVLQENIVAVGDLAARRFYQKIGSDLANPRFVQTLRLWTPTLGLREQTKELLVKGGYSQETRYEGYVFRKDTYGVVHSVELKGLLWEAANNWTNDTERNIFERTKTPRGSGLRYLEDSDNFIFACRHYAVDSILGRGANLLDVVMILEECHEHLEWTRIRELLGQLQKAEWFWVTMLALNIFEGRTGRRLSLPEFVREGLKEFQLDSFWVPFLESRLNWSNPDKKLSEFSRAYVKLAKGT